MCMPPRIQATVMGNMRRGRAPHTAAMMEPGRLRTAPWNPAPGTAAAVTSRNVEQPDTGGCSTWHQVWQLPA